MHHSKKHFSLFIAILLFSISSYAQDKAYAKSCITTLSSPEYHGRGYVKKGDKKAAKFIAKELKRWGAKAFEGSYYQYVNFDINTIKNTKLIVDGKNLEPGVDYLVYASSSSIQGEYELYQPESFVLNDFLSQNHKNKIFILDTINNKSKDLIDNYKKLLSTCAYKNAAAVIEVTSRKLVHTMRTYELGFPYLQVKSESWDNKSQQAKIQVKTKFIPNYKSQNVIAYIEGEIDSFYVFGAHYDHLGRISKDVYFPGANDNASGVATVLNMAKNFSETGKKPKYSIAFMLFTAEEAGLIGSHYYTDHPLFPLEKVKFLFNLDMVGTGIKGLSIVNGKAFPEASELVKQISEENQYFDNIRVGKVSSNSDHYFFYDKGVPAVFLFTRGGPRFYHDVYDRIETLELNKHEELIQLLLEFMNRYE